MDLFIVLGVIVLITFVVLGVLFFMLSKEQGSLQMRSGEEKSSLEDEAYKKRAKELEDELRAITLKADRQSDEARHLIETLTKENESLKSQQANLEQAQQKLLESTNAKARLLEEEMAVVKIQMGEEISRANAMVSELNREKEALKYELIKARAQSSGLERVSFNYKNQLEDFFKKVNAAQVSNDHLSQVKNRLEGMVQEVKLQNEELVKKDQLAQFELEKNRSRLVSLERQYEELRTQQKNQ